MLLLHLLFALGAAQCAYNCSEHGSCVGTSCDCLTPWQGPQCSVFPLGALPCSSSVSASLPAMLPDDSLTFSVVVSQELTTLSVSTPLLSVYARLGQAPSPAEYDFASSSGSLVIVDARVGTWYVAAVAGQNVSAPSVGLGCSFVCPNNCTGRGACVAGVCQCSSASYSGPDCSVWVELLAADTPFVWNCSAGGPQPMVGLQLAIGQTRVPLLRLQLVSGAGTVLGAGGGRTPTRASFDVRLAGAAGAEVEVLGAVAAAGPWLLAAQQCTGLLGVSFWAGPACPNDCRGRGECDAASAACLCTPPYQLPDCGPFLDALSDGETRRTNLLEPWQRHDYSLIVGAPASGLALSLAADTPGLQLLLGAGDAPPAPDAYLAAAVTNGSSSDAVLAHGWQRPLLPGRYWATVLAPPPGDPLYPLEYSLSLSLSHDCPGDCGAPGRGTCLPGGLCQCFPPWVLGDCSARSLQVTPDRVLSGSAFVSGWDYYFIRIHTGNAVLVRLQELAGTGGRVWLFVRFGALPSLSQFLAADMSHDAAHSVLIRSRDAADNATLYVGVFGSALMAPGSSPLPYSLAVTTGCQTYSECGLCVSDPDCGWCLPQPFNASAGLCLAGTSKAPFAGGLCGTWAFSKCDVSAQQAFVLNLGLLVGAAIGLLVLAAVALTGLCVFRRIQAEEQLKLSRLQNLDRGGDEDEPLVARLSPH